MDKVNTYYAPSVDLAELAEALTSWFQSRKFNCQILAQVDGGRLLQAAPESGWRMIVGAPLAVNVVLRRRERYLDVEIGAGKWLEKESAEAAGTFFLQAALTAVREVLDQAKVPERVFDFVARYVAEASAAPAPALAGPTAGPAESQEAMYYLTVGGQTVGPLPRSQVLLGVQQGAVPPSALVCPMGGEEWRRLADHPEFASNALPLELLPPDEDRLRKDE